MTDASRLRVVGGAAVMAGAVAIAAFLGTRDRVATPAAPVAAPMSPGGASAPRATAATPERPLAQGQAPERAPAQPAAPPRASATSQDPSQVPAQASPQASARSESRAARPADPARADPPRFDVVRMGARGMVVVAGRAAPGAEVVLFEGGREIGRARADSRGEWVILPADPLGAGARELSLRARLTGGEEMAGPDTVLVVGPAPAEPQVAQAPPREEVPRAAPRREDASSPASRQPGPPAAGPAPRAAGPGTGEGPAGESRLEGTRDAQPAGNPGAEARTAETGSLPARTPATEPRPAETHPAETHPAETRPAETARPEQALVLLLPPTAAAAPRILSAPPGAAMPNASLGLDVVDYDDSNTMRFAGTAPPGAQLRVYSDDRHLGDAQADQAGRWSLTPAEAPPVGRHMLRVDQLGTSAATGASPAVANRVEVAFQREALPAGTIRDGQVVVQPGNNLWRIARDAYGRGIRYTVIYRANQAQIRNPARIYPGQVFAVPEVR